MTDDHDGGLQNVSAYVLTLLYDSCQLVLLFSDTLFQTRRRAGQHEVQRAPTTLKLQTTLFDTVC